MTPFIPYRSAVEVSWSRWRGHHKGVLGWTFSYCSTGSTELERASQGHWLTGKRGSRIGHSEPQDIDDLKYGFVSVLLKKGRTSYRADFCPPLQCCSQSRNSSSIRERDLSVRRHSKLHRGEGRANERAISPKGSDTIAEFDKKSPISRYRNKWHDEYSVMGTGDSK